jgi:hypothetical protein
MLQACAGATQRGGDKQTLQCICRMAGDQQGIARPAHHLVHQAQFGGAIDAAALIQRRGGQQPDRPALHLPMDNAALASAPGAGRRQVETACGNAGSACSRL